MRGLNNIPFLLSDETAEKPGNFIINDIELDVPPTAISVHKEGLQYSMKSLRTKVSTKILSGSGVHHAQIKITFPQDSLLLLHRLICEIKNSPFVSIKNNFISESIGRAKIGDTIEVFTVMGLQVSNHPSSPNAFLCELDLRLFNHKPYTKYFGYKKEFLNKINDKYYTHQVFSYGKTLKRVEVSIQEEISNNKKSYRNIESNNFQKLKNQKINNEYSRLFVSNAKESNAYKRYANFLQIKSLSENFGIEITTDTNIETINIIAISEKLLSAFESGNLRKTRFPKVYGLHELVREEKRESITFRNKVIYAMLSGSKNFEITYKEFLRYNGDPEFLRRFRNSIDLETKRKTTKEKNQLRRKNLESIQEAFRKLEEEGTVTVKKDPEVKTLESFKQIDESLRLPNGFEEISAKNNSDQDIEFYPPVTKVKYKKVYYNTGFHQYSVTSDDKQVIPIFSSIDGTLQKTPKGLRIFNKTYNLHLKFKSNVKEQEIEVSGEVSKGDVIGFINLDEDTLKLDSNKDLDSLIENTVKKKPKALKKDKFIFGEIRESDYTEYLKLKAQLDKKGYRYNTSRTSEETILENRKTLAFINITPQESIDFITGERKNNALPISNSNIVTNISGSIRHLTASIPILGLESPTHQFLGSIEPNYQVSFISKDTNGGLGESIKEIENLRSLMQFNAKNFAFIPDSGNIHVSCLITKLLGSENIYEDLLLDDINIPNKELLDDTIYPNMMISSTDTFTIEGSPGVTGLHFRFSESKSFTEEKIAPVRVSKVASTAKSEAIQRIKYQETTKTNKERPPVFSSFALSNSPEKNGLKDWKTRSFNSLGWYRHATRSGKKYSLEFTEKDIALDNNGFLFIKEYLQPLQDFLDVYKPEKKFKIKFRSTFDDYKSSHRDTLSNHFANLAADIYVPGMNVMELGAVIISCLEAGIIKGESLRGDAYSNKNIRNAGLGIYGKEAHIISNVMNGSKKNGFIHIDANFSVSKNNNNLSYSPKSSWRIWAGRTKQDAFRVLEHNTYNFGQSNTEQDVYYSGSDAAEITSLARQSAYRFWGLPNYNTSYLKTEIYPLIESEVEAAFLRLAEGVTSEEQEITEQETSEEEFNETVNEEISGLQEDSIKDVEALRKELSNYFNTENNIDLKRITYEEVSKNLNANTKYKFNENLDSVNKDYTFITIRDNFDDINSNREENKRVGLDKIKKYLNNTRYIVLNDKERNISTSGSQFGTNELLIAIPKNDASYIIKKPSKQEEQLDKMIANFQLLASIILTEPHLYTSNEEEAKVELARIQKELEGLEIVPCLYSYLETNIVGTNHLAGNIKQDVEIDVNTDEKLNASVTAVALGGAAVAGLEVAAAVIAGTALLAPVALLALAGFGLLAAINSTIDETNIEPSFDLQTRRVKQYLESRIYKEDYKKYYLNKVTQLLTYYTGDIKGSIDKDLAKEIFRHFGDSETIDKGINQYFKNIFANNYAFKYFNEIAEGLKTESSLKSLLNYRASETNIDEDSKTIHKFIGNTLILGGGTVRSYFNFLYQFPYEYDYLNNDTLANEIYSINEDGSLSLKEETFGDDFYYFYNGSLLSERQKEVLFDHQLFKSENLDGIFFTQKRKNELRQNQKDKIDWLKGILSSLLETKLKITKDERLKDLSLKIDSLPNIYDSDTYPDIVLPDNPYAHPLNRKLSPAFYHWSTKDLSEKSREIIFSRTQENSKNILRKSLKFEEAVRKGLYTGPKSILKQALDEKNALSEATKIKLNKYTFKDKADIFVGTEDIDKSKLNEIIKRNVTVAGIPDKNTIDNLKSTFSQLSGEGKIKISDSPTSNSDLRNLKGGENEEYLNSFIRDIDESYANFYQEHDLTKAYPTFKLYLIEEDEEVSDMLYAYDDFYYYNSVVSFNFYNSKELSAQTATIQVQNISGTLDGTKKGILRDIDIDRSTRETPYAADDNVVVDSIVLRPGINVQLRAGYGEHSRDLTVLLNGRVTEVQYSGDNMIANITVQSFGTELDGLLKNSYAKSNDYTYNTTSEVLASLTFSEELKHFGRFKKGKIFQTGERRDTLALDIEYLDDEVSFTYSLFKGTLDFFERNRVAILAGAILLEFAGPAAAIAKAKWIAPGGRLANTLEKVTPSISKISGKITGKLSKVPFVGKTFSYLNPTANYVKTKEFLSVLTGRRFGSNVLKIDPTDFSAINNALSTYQKSRLTGRWWIPSLSNKLSKANVQVSNEVLEQVSLRIAVQNGGYQAGLKLLKDRNVTGFFKQYSALSKTFINVGVGQSIFNSFNLISRSGGLLAFSVSAAIIGVGAGLILDTLALPFGSNDELSFQRRKERLRKKVIYSPIDDNLFPPNKDSYIVENKDNISSSVMNLFGGAISTTVDNMTISQLILSDGEDFDAEKYINSKIKRSSKMLINGKDSQFIISSQSIWNTLKELTYRHPGYIYGYKPYGESFEYRLFFGKGNQKYFSYGITSRQAERLNLLEKTLKEGLDAETVASNLRVLYPDSFKKIMSQNYETEEKTSLALEELTKVAYEEYIQDTKARLKPYRSIHNVDSHRDLIQNNINTSGHNVINTVNVQYRADYEDRENQSNENDFFTIKLKASGNIPPELEKAKTISMQNINGVGNANRYGLAELMAGIKKMYEGSLLTLGNTKIHPWDFIILNDKVNNMYGPLEVNAVTHMFSHETGFLTDIEVNAVVSSNDFFSLPMIKQSVIYQAKAKILDDYTSRGDLGLTGDEVADKEILRDILKETISEMGEDKDIVNQYKNTFVDASNPLKAVKDFFLSGSDLNEEVLNNLTETIYANYKNPASMNFVNDIVNYEAEAPEEIADATAVVSRTVGGTGVVGAGVVGAKRRLQNINNVGTRVGGRRLVGGGILSGLLVLDSLTFNFTGKAARGISKHFFDNYLEQNLAKPFIMAKSSEESIVKIMPLIKDGKPLIAGGLEKVSEEEKWNNILGNFYNNMSDGYLGLRRYKDELKAKGAAIIADDENYSWMEETKIGVNYSLGYLLGIDTEYTTAYLYGDDSAFIEEELIDPDLGSRKVIGEE